MLDGKGSLMVNIPISYATKHVMHKSNARLHEPLFLGFSLLITQAAFQALLDTAVLQSASHADRPLPL